MPAGPTADQQRRVEGPFDDRRNKAIWVLAGSSPPVRDNVAPTQRPAAFDGREARVLDRVGVGVADNLSRKVLTVATVKLLTVTSRHATR